MTIQVTAQRLVGTAAVDEVMAATRAHGRASERVAARWRRSGGVQERTLLTAALDGGPSGAGQRFFLEGSLAEVSHVVEHAREAGAIGTATVILGM